MSALSPAYEFNQGQSDEWYTPWDLLAAIGLSYDLDPCSPGPNHWVPARRVHTKEADGLKQPWQGRVFVNPPFGGRNGHVPWLERFIAHGNGIAIARAYTSAGWFHQITPRADGILFPRGKTKFIRPDGTVGKNPGTGIVILAMGRTCCEALRASGLGLYVSLRQDGAA